MSEHTNIFHKFTIREPQAVLIHDRLRSHVSTLKNWTATAVETGDLKRAQGLVAEMREFERLAACFNVKAKRETALIAGKPIEVDHGI